MLTPYEIEQRLERARILKAQAVTPQHAAAEGSMDAEEDRAEEDRRRVQHEADPVLPEAPEVARADLGKAYRDAVPGPADFPLPGHVSPGMPARGPLTEGHAAYSPGYAPSAQPVAVPSATLHAAAITRPLLTGGRARPSADGGRP